MTRLIRLPFAATILLAAMPQSAQVSAQSIDRPAEESSADSDDIFITATRATTATKTDTAIVDVPQAISVITADQIAARGATGVQEALRYTPGVRTEPNGADYRFDYVTGRGGFDAQSYIDGMRQPTSFYTSRIEAYNLDRIEVLRGPSSVLYGQGAAGGIVNSITKRPQFETGGEIAVQYGSFDRKQVQLDLTGPLDRAGTVAARLVGVVRDADNQNDFGKDGRIFIAPSLRYRPDDRTDIVLEGLYQRDRAASISTFLPLGATLLAPPGRKLRFGTYLGEPGLNAYNSEQYSISLLGTHRLSDALTFTSAVRYNHSDTYNANVQGDFYTGAVDPFLDPDHRLYPRVRSDAKARLTMFTTDNNLRADFTTGAFTHKLLFGIDYQRSTLKSAFLDAAADPIDIYAPVYGNIPEGSFAPAHYGVDTQLGFYAQDQINYAGRIILALGVRHDRATSSVDDDRQVDKATSFRAGLIVKLGETISPYVSYSESFQPTIGLNYYGKRFQPQRGRQYEAGVKWQPDVGTLVALSAFDILGTNRLETDPLNGNNQIQQGEVKSRGFEIEASRTVARNVTVTASYSHVAAKLGRSADPLAVGLPISAVPRDQASVWGEKSFALSDDMLVRIGAGVRYVGPSTEAVIFNDIVTSGAVERLTTPGFTVADALVAVDKGRWSLAVNATNLFDNEYYASCSVRSACGAGYRRNVIGTLGYRF
ncbi:MAG: TonB-dependent siderophore receptor [Pseudomonadota bacterium]